MFELGQYLRSHMPEALKATKPNVEPSPTQFMASPTHCPSKYVIRLSPTGSLNHKMEPLNTTVVAKFVSNERMLSRGSQAM
jgi:hypothetical protein